MRHTVIAAFVNLTAGTIFHPPVGDPVSLALRQRVTPPGQFESHDEEQIERLIRARCLRESDTALERILRADGPADTVSPPATPSGDPVSHATNADPAPDQNAAAGAIAPAVVDGQSPASETATANPTPFPGGAAAPAEPPAPAAAATAPAPAAPAAAPAAPAAPAPAASSDGGAGPAPVAGADGGGRGDGTVSHRERRKAARAAAGKPS